MKKGGFIMVTKSLNGYIKIYQEQLLQGDIQIAYENLLKYMIRLKGDFSRVFSEEYVFGNVSPGYMDFTYFPFYNEFLRSKKLRFGIVLNHKKMYFELWLMGQNEQVQLEYWRLLKETNWNENKNRPQYSVLEAVLVTSPNFDDLAAPSVEIKQEAEKAAKEVLNYLLEIDKNKVRR